jgi:hypothetical protein
MASNTANLTNNLEQKVTQLQAKRRKLADAYKKEKKVEVTISPMYRPYFGNNMPVQINGVAVYVPIDGQTYKIPESFAAVVKERISLIDEQLRAREAMANVQANVEKYAGEKGLLTKV